MRKKFIYGILDDFVTKQLPNNVTWLVSMLYALEHKGDRALVSTQGQMIHFNFCLLSLRAAFILVLFSSYFCP